MNWKDKIAGLAYPLNDSVIKPLARRLGTYISGAITAILMIDDPQHVATIEGAVLILIGVAVDLFFSNRSRR